MFLKFFPIMYIGRNHGIIYIFQSSGVCLQAWSRRVRYTAFIMGKRKLFIPAFFSGTRALPRDLVNATGGGEDREKWSRSFGKPRRRTIVRTASARGGGRDSLLTRKKLSPKGGCNWAPPPPSSLHLNNSCGLFVCPPLPAGGR